MRSHSLVAFNTATQSDNKIHDDDVARRFGFTGGLVPGVDVYAYLTWGPASMWGRDWLERGTMHARFAQPAYDGETVIVEVDEQRSATLGLVLRNQSGTALANGGATLPAEPAPAPDVGRYPTAPLPPAGERPPASPESLSEGTALGTWEVGWHADRAGEYLRDAREELPLYEREGVAHPGWVLRLANTTLAANVVLGPWIHVGSEVTHHGCITDGAKVACRGSVTAEYERKGHQFVELDLLVLADEAPVATIAHTAIYRPRQLREPS